MHRNAHLLMVLAALSLAATLVLGPAGHMVTRAAGSSGTPPPPPPPPGTIVLVTPTPGKAVKLPKSFPVLSKKQQKLAVQIVKKDKVARPLLHGRKYKVSTISIWLDKSLHVLGAVVTVHFSAPQTISGKFVGLSYPCSASAPQTYTRVPYLAKYAEVTYMTLSISFKKKRVEGMTPFGALVGTIRLLKPVASRPTGLEPISCHT